MNIEENLGEWHSRFQQFSTDADLIIVLTEAEEIIPSGTQGRILER